MSATSTHAYTRSHTSTYASGKLGNLLKLLVRYHGLDPQEVVDAWSDWVDYAARTWLESGHLNAITIEFYWPGSDVAVARWDFPIRYDGNDVDEMWVDRAFFEGSLAKAKEGICCSPIISLPPCLSSTLRPSHFLLESEAFCEHSPSAFPKRLFPRYIGMLPGHP